MAKSGTAKNDMAKNGTTKAATTAEEAIMITTTTSHRTRRHVGPRFAACFLLASALACGGRMPDGLGVANGRLSPCPSSPNCVASGAKDELHSIAPLALSASADAAWRALVADLEGRPRVEIVTSRDGYLHAVFTSRLMRYRDDVEFQLAASGRAIEVRSASRIGHGDMGVNRERIESIRAALAAQGVVAAASGG